MSRFLQSSVTFGDAWDTPIYLSSLKFYQQCMDEVSFWFDNCSFLNCKMIEYCRPVPIICTDASGFWHALFVDKDEFGLLYKDISSMESALDSNGTELLAILYAQSLLHRLFRVKRSNSILTARMRLLFLRKAVLQLG